MSRKIWAITLTSIIIFSLIASLAITSMTVSGMQEQHQIIDNVAVHVTKQHQSFFDVIYQTARGWKTNASWGLVQYTYYTHNTVVNNGHDFIQCKMYGVVSAITCTAGDFANFISVSTDSTAPAVTDTGCTAEVLTNGFSRVASTITTGTPSAGSVSILLKHVWTSATVGTNGLQKTCMWTEVNGGLNPVLFAENTFPSTNVVPGNTLEIDWTFTYT